MSGVVHLGDLGGLAGAGTAAWRPVAARAASLLLRYPDAPVRAALPAVRAALPELPAAVAGPLAALADHRGVTDADALAAEYVALFDFRRRSALHLTFYTCGDTRRRGAALAGFQDAYRAAGLAVVGGELPDYLPAVLDVAAADPVGWRLLADHRVGLDLLAQALADSPYRHGVAAVRATLPPPGRHDRDRVRDLARAGPPVEQVGLEPYALPDSAGGRR